MKRKLLTIAVTALLAGMAGYTAEVVAAKGSPGPPPGKGGGGSGEETYGNNLSVPTIFAPSVGQADVPALRVSCPGGSQAPTGDPVSIAGGSYYLQKTASTWTADCANAGGLPLVVQADWGDNLTGGGRLSAGKPIRIEMLLHDVSGSFATGFAVLKLTDDIDRLATYGTDGTPQANMSFIVFDSGAKLRIDKCASATDTVCQAGNVYDGPMTAEINSTGKVVYGFNWGTGTTTTPSPGTYKITWLPSNTWVKSAADGSVCQVAEPVIGNQTCAYVIVTLSGKGGGRPSNPGGGEE